MLKVMTLNINYYGDRYGPWSRRRELIHQAITATAAGSAAGAAAGAGAGADADAAGGDGSPDIVALQAVRQDPDFEGGLSQVEQLASLLPGYEYRVFVPAIYDSDGSADGSAVLSRLPFSEVAHEDLTLLPGLDDRNLRSILHARFNLPGGPLHLFNGHFSWVEEQARLNLAEALEFMRPYRGKKLLVGDLNTTPDSTVFDRLRQDGWTDAWAALRPDEPGYTFESGEPKIRIDYLWVNQDLKAELQGIEIIADNPGEENVRVSDHYGLMATFSTRAEDKAEGE